MRIQGGWIGAAVLVWVWAIPAAAAAQGKAVDPQTVTMCFNESNAVGPDDAIKACDALERTNSQHGRNLAMVYHARSIADINKQDFGQAVVDAGSAILIDPTYSDGYNERGRAYDAQGDTVKAAADFDEAIRRDPKSVAALLNRSVLFSRAGDADHALALANRAIIAAPLDAAAWDQRGISHAWKKNYSAAITDYGWALRLNPGLTMIYAERGQALAGAGRSVEALADFARALRINPINEDAFMWRASLYDTLGRPGRAIADYDRAYQLNPKDVGALNGRCWARAMAKQELDVARAACDAALAQLPKDAGIWDSRGMVGLKQQRWQDAWNDYDAATRLDAANAGYLYGRGLAAMRLGRADGQADITAATGRDPNIAAVYATRGETP